MKKLILILCVLLAFAPLYGVHAAPLVNRASAFAPTATAVSITVPNVGTSAIQLIGAVTSGTLAYQTILSGCGGCDNIAHGTLSDFNAATGIVMYTPSTGFTGSETFGYKVSDGTSTSSEAVVTITVSSSRTTVTGPIIKPDGTNYTGTIIFQLTKRANVSAGLMPVIAPVTATLSSGTFSVSLYPSTTLYTSAGEKVYYQVRLRTTQGEETLGIYDIPALSSSVSLTSLSAVASAQGSSWAYVSQAAFNAFLGRSFGVTVNNTGATVTGGPFSTLDFIPGANISIVTVDNGSGNLGITISDPTGGSGGTVGSATSGQVAVYNGATSVNGKAFAGATRIFKTNATNNGTEWDTLTAGTGITVTHSTGDVTIATTAITNLNGLTGATQAFTSSGGTCGSSFAIASGSTTHTFCQPDASATATGVITASGTQQVIAGEKLFTGFSNSDVPVTVKQKASGSDTLTTWQDSSSVTTNEISRFGSWHRTLNVGVSEGTPTSYLNNGYLAKFYETFSDYNTDVSKGLRTSIAYTGGTSSGTSYSMQPALDLGESGNLTSANHSALLATFTHSGSATLTGGAGLTSTVTNSAGTTTTLYNVKTNSNISAGTITSLFGFYGTAPASTGGTITNAYGMYLESLTAGSATNYALYTNSGHVSIGDALTIRGISAPAVGAADTVKQYYDSAADKWMASANGAAYAGVGLFLEGTATLDFPSTAANSYADLTISVTGAVAGKPVFLGAPNGSVNANCGFVAWASATNTITVRHLNNSAGAVDPASGSFTVCVAQ